MTLNQYDNDLFANVICKGGKKTRGSRALHIRALEEDLGGDKKVKGQVSKGPRDQGHDNG